MKHYKQISILLCIAILFNVIPMYAKGQHASNNMIDGSMSIQSDLLNVTSGSLISTAPAISSAPGISATPDVTSGPAISTAPAISSAPGISATPNVTTEPAVTSKPPATTKPVVTSEPPATTNPPVSTESVKPSEEPVTPSASPSPEPAQPSSPTNVTPATLSVRIVNTTDNAGSGLSTAYVPKNEKMTVSVVVEEADTSNLQYQWYQDGQLLNGEISATYTITGSLGQHSYTCNVVSGTRTGTATVNVIGYNNNIQVTIGKKQKMADVFGSTDAINQKNITELKVTTKKAKKSFKIINGNTLQPTKYYSKCKVSFKVNDQTLVVTVRVVLPKVKLNLTLSKNKKILRGVPKAFGASKIEFQYQIRNSKKWGNNSLVSGKFRKPNKMGCFKNPTPILIKKYRVRAVYKTETGKKIYTKWTTINL